MMSLWKGPLLWRNQLQWKHQLQWKDRLLWRDQLSLLRPREIILALYLLGRGFGVSPVLWGICGW